MRHCWSDRFAPQSRTEEGVLRGDRHPFHGGPDAGGAFAEEGVGLGFRRLSIIDLETGDQPLFNEDRSLVLTCNGEIYNYRELREELCRRGHSFRTQTDVEVFLHLYEEEGPAFLGRLNGQFAFALYDRREKALLLARDQFGIFPSTMRWSTAC